MFCTHQVHDDGTPTTRTFDHVKSEIGAEEAEEVGVEHLLRDIKDTTVGTLSQHLTTQVLVFTSHNTGTCFCSDFLSFSVPRLKCDFITFQGLFSTCIPTKRLQIKT